MAIPMKRQMINIEQFALPLRIAAAETFARVHAKSSKGLRAAKALGFAGLLRDRQGLGEGLGTINASLERFRGGAPSDGRSRVAPRHSLRGLVSRTVVFSWDFSYLSPPAPSSVCGSARPCSSRHVVLGCGRPVLQAQGVVQGAGFTAIVQWTLWFERPAWWPQD